MSPGICNYASLNCSYETQLGMFPRSAKLLMRASVAPMKSKCYVPRSLEIQSADETSGGSIGEQMGEQCSHWRRGVASRQLLAGWGRIGGCRALGLLRGGVQGIVGLPGRNPAVTSLSAPRNPSLDRKRGKIDQSQAELEPR